MGKSWQFQPHDASQVQHLHRIAGVAPVVAQLLVSRGITDPQIIERFLEAKLSDLRDPELLPGVTQAADRICRAIREHRPITIFGDYDADGMTSTAILLRGLRILGAIVDYYVPSRVDEGYGLNNEALGMLAERGVRQVISVDCGIASLREALFAKQLGLELIITDHHELQAEVPCAAAVVHPCLPGHNYPFAGLCGAGVAFKLIWHVCRQMSEAQRVSERLKHFLLSAMGLAAIGTVADVVPLLDENRVIVRHGLNMLKASPIVGVAALMQVAGLDKQPRLQSDDIAFMLAPRLNAAGRLGKADLAIELLTTDSASRAEELATQINELNATRMDVENDINQAARRRIAELYFTDKGPQPAFVVDGRGWHVGVIGIVAGRICEQYHRPTIVLAKDEHGAKQAVGSGRSIPGFNLNRALHVCGEYLIKHGGHAAAAGLLMEEEQIPAFRAAFSAFVAAELSPADYQPRLTIDAEAALPQLTLTTVKQLERLSPFGQDHPRPTLCARGVRLGNQPKRMGRGERHLSVMLEQNEVRMRAIAFHQGQWAEELQQHQGPLDVAYRPVLNEYNGRRSVEVHIVDWKPAEQLHIAAG